MKENILSFSKDKIKINFTFYDFLIILLVVASLAFYDIKVVFLGIQLLAFACSFLRACNRRINLYMLIYICWLILFCVLSLSSSLWASPQNSTVLSVTLSIIQVGLICFCVMDYCADELHLHRIIWAFIVACAFLSIRFVLSVPISQWGQGDRFSKDTIFGSNTAALILSYGAVIALWLVLEKKQTRIKQVLLFLGIAVFMFVSMMMGTRKGIVAFLIGMVLLLLMKAKKPTEMFGKIFLIAILLLAIYFIIMQVPVLYNSIGYRIESLLSGLNGGETDDSTFGRMYMLEAAWKTFLNYPILGVGQDGFRYVNSYALTYSHNNYVEILANLGIIGFVFYYGLYFWMLKKSIKLGKYKDLPICILIIILVLDLGAVSYGTEVTYILLGIVFGFIVSKKGEKNA